MFLSHLSFLVVVLIGMVVLGDGQTGSNSALGALSGSRSTGPPVLNSKGRMYFLMGSSSCWIDYNLLVDTHNVVEPKISTSGFGCKNRLSKDLSQFKVTPYIQKLKYMGLYEIGINVQEHSDYNKNTEWAAPRVKLQMQSEPKMFCEPSQGFRGVYSPTGAHIASICPEAGSGKGSVAAEKSIKLMWNSHGKKITTDLMLRAVLSTQGIFSAMVYDGKTSPFQEESNIVKYIRPITSDGLFEIGLDDKKNGARPRINVRVDGTGIKNFCSKRQGMDNATGADYSYLEVCR